VYQFVVRAFNRARKAGRWHGANPAEQVETRKVPETVVEILRPEEVLPFFLQQPLRGATPETRRTARNTLGMPR
jgi:hypothetical protein